MLAGCGPERGAITAGGRIFGDNLTVYTSVPDPATGLGRDMVDASKLAIAQAGGRAGDFGINFVAVDEGSPAHPDPPIVAARAAERTIRDTQVIAVVGALRSDTAMTSLPLFNAAGLLLVSPGAGYPGFTSAVAPGEPERWYPSGRRTFGRLIGDDREQARALVAAAGDGTVAIESEAGEAAAALADAVRTEAGDRVVEDPARAGAVIYAGSDVDSAAAFARQTPRATLVFPDELTRAGLARRLAPAARRRAVFVSSAPETRLDGRAARVRGRVRGGVRAPARPLRGAGLAGHAPRARRDRGGGHARAGPPRGGGALPHATAPAGALHGVPDAGRRAEI